LIPIRASQMHQFARLAIQLNYLLTLYLETGGKAYVKLKPFALILED
jgi:hypothetical protein